MLNQCDSFGDIRSVSFFKRTFTGSSYSREPEWPTDQLKNGIPGHPESVALRILLDGSDGNWSTGLELRESILNNRQNYF